MPHLKETSPSLPANNAREFIAFAKKNPGKLNVAYAGALGQTVFSRFAQAVGIDVAMIPYKGIPEEKIDLLAGRIQLYLDATGIIPSYRAGQVNVLAISGSNRLPDNPDIPTVSELGVPDRLPPSPTPAGRLGLFGLDTIAPGRPHQPQIRHLPRPHLAAPKVNDNG